MKNADITEKNESGNESKSKEENAMKIYEMSTERALECMTKIVPHMVEIVSDPQVAEVKKMLLEKGAQATNSDVMEAIYPLLMDKHRDAVCGMIAAMSDKTVDEVKKQPWQESFAQIKAGFANELFDVFPYAVRLFFSR